ncbi:ATP-binding cassette domain-containing protein [Clostridium sp. OF10-22XD]|nr:ATP-binding cassette domain-containing protein [Clostridium sp. OF10-22XD]
MSIHLEIKNIKNIQYADLFLPSQKGMYALVGENGCGKSTIMLALSLMIKKSSNKLLSENDLSQESLICLEMDELADNWRFKDNRLVTDVTELYRGHPVLGTNIKIQGFYEGSIFFGTRFYDYGLVDDFMKVDNFEDELIEADDFVKETLGYILHNDKSYYNSLLKVKNRSLARKYNFRGMPYFRKIGDKYISQYRMSSGESMLISLIDFINNLVVRNTGTDKLLFLIDEVELALHPSAIDRLVEILDGLVKKSSTELIVYFSTHSAELLHRIPSKNIFLLENNGGNVVCTNPCYPNYAIRNLYVPNGFDFLLLVEDMLAKALVEKVIRNNRFGNSKLICVLPAGGCNQMLQLHHDMITYNTLGVGKRIISIYDGDVKKEISKKKEYKNLHKCFLPIPSIEKYLKTKLVDIPDPIFIKLIGDKYFTQRSLQSILLDYKNDPRTKIKGDNDGKNLYKVLTANLYKVGIDEDHFIMYLCDDIFDYEDLNKFINTLNSLLY